MSFLISALVRQCANKVITYQQAVEQFQLSNAEQIELIVILKSMERYHG